MRSAPQERGQGRMHGEWHGAELARGVLEQAIAISTASLATGEVMQQPQQHGAQLWL